LSSLPRYEVIQTRGYAQIRGSDLGRRSVRGNKVCIAAWPDGSGALG